MLSEDQLDEKLTECKTSIEDILKDKDLKVNSKTLIYGIAKQCLS